LFPTQSITGGTNALNKHSIIKLIEYANIKAGDIVWEIGMGLPKLALMLAYVTKTTVVGTDIGKSEYCVCVTVFTIAVVVL
jgi:16S rRNA A1518/A1519 N6-dimethyltransferase RsmA/KsgA/DIM1 with predicted DNA glycosylase/AP lyase activity